MILRSALRAIAMVAVATADLQVQQIPQKNEREDGHEDESSVELGLGAHSTYFWVHALSVCCRLVQLTMCRVWWYAYPYSFRARCSCDGCVDMLFGSVGVRTVG